MVPTTVPILQPVESTRSRIVLQSRVHYGSPLFGYLLAFALVSVMTVVGRTLVTSSGFPYPFIFFYPAIIAASFLGGAGPGLFAVFLAGASVSTLFPNPPMPWNWIALAVLGPLLASGFGHLRLLHERNSAVARDLVKFKFIGDHASDWILLLTVDGRIRYVNIKAATDLGWTDQELNGRAIETLVRETQRPAVRRALEMAQAGLAKPLELEFERRDKTAALMELGCTAVSTGEEQVIYAAARDITERRQIEKKLQEIRHWESLGALSAGLAHDFNNLLTSILGNATLARSVIAYDTEAAPMLDGIISAAERSSDLVLMLLATAGYRSRYSERLRIDQLLEWTLARQRLPGNVRVEKKAEATTIMGDRRSFETLLWSLISNAAEAYGDQQGEVSVTIKSAPAPAPLAQEASFEEGDAGAGDCVGIVVADRGEGMSPEILKRAFDPFFSTRFTGRGLGLAAVRGIVRAYSGRLSLATAVGKGTRVEIWLPVSRA